MVLDDKPTNQKVTLSTETIELLNESADGGQSYDTIIQEAIKEKVEERKKKKASAAEKKEENKNK